jgi:hypothetical protein
MLSLNKARSGLTERLFVREAGLDVPVHVATENMDLSADLKRALAHARAGKQDKKQKARR